MGDRANIRFRAETADPPIHFYTHWGGDDLPIRLQNALKRKDRWDDDAYLARMIFCEMVKGEVDGSTGFGISLHICDNEHPIINVNVQMQTVSWNENRWSFEEYIAILPDALRVIWETSDYTYGQDEEEVQPVPVVKPPPEQPPVSDGIRKIEMPIKTKIKK